VASKQLTTNFDLLERINSIIERADVIYTRNFNKHHDGLALKALDSSRNTIELLAKISISLAQAREREAEIAEKQRGIGSEAKELKMAKRMKFLTLDEVKVLSNIRRKMISGDRSIDALDIGSYTAYTEVEDDSIA